MRAKGLCHPKLVGLMRVEEVRELIELIGLLIWTQTARDAWSEKRIHDL